MPFTVLIERDIMKAVKLRIIIISIMREIRYFAPHGYLILTNIYQQLAGCISEVQLLPNENNSTG